MNHWCEYPQTSSGASPILPEARKRAQARKIVCESMIPMNRKRELFQLIESSRGASLDLVDLQRQVRQLEAEYAAQTRRRIASEERDILEQVQAEVALEERAKLPSMIRGGRKGRKSPRRKSPRRSRKSRKSRRQARRK